MHNWITVETGMSLSVLIFIVSLWVAYALFTTVVRNFKPKNIMKVDRFFSLWMMLISLFTFGVGIVMVFTSTGGSLFIAFLVSGMFLYVISLGSLIYGLAWYTLFNGTVDNGENNE
jgi:hypothetical protein